MAYWAAPPVLALAYGSIELEACKAKDIFSFMNEILFYCRLQNFDFV
jgi:hypothetical protein